MSKKKGEVKVLERKFEQHDMCLEASLQTITTRSKMSCSYYKNWTNGYWSKAKLNDEEKWV